MSTFNNANTIGARMINIHAISAALMLPPLSAVGELRETAGKTS